MTYTEAKAMADAYAATTKRLGAAMGHFPRGPMNLTTDAARATPEYKVAKLALDRAFAQERAFNTYFVKTFKVEIKADRAAKCYIRQVAA